MKYIVLFVASLIYTFCFAFMLKDLEIFNECESSDRYKKFHIKKKYCRAGKRNSVNFIGSGETYKCIAVGHNQCLALGDSISLLFSPKHDRVFNPIAKKGIKRNIILMTVLYVIFLVLFAFEIFRK